MNSFFKFLFSNKTLSSFVIVMSMSIVLLSCDGTASKNGKGKDADLYSPISLYFNPLQNTDYDYYSSYLPYFLNYPDDWAKMGLHGRPSYVKYSSVDHWTGRTVDLTYRFGALGNLEYITNSALGTDEFVYDMDSRLQDIRRVKHVNWDGFEGQFVYADSLLVKRKISPTRSTSHSFSYYPDGVLKEITPDKGIYYSNGMKLGKLEFNTEGQLVRTEAASSYNPYIFTQRGYDSGDSPSVCTFVYDRNGLCTEKKETIRFKHHNNRVDTLICVNRYEYNDKGDLKAWTYEGACREDVNGNTWRFVDRSFTITFDYTYDDKGNWLTKTVTLPDCYKDVDALAKFYEMRTKGYYYTTPGGDSSADMAEGSKSKVTIVREIGPYHEIDADEFRAAKKKMKAEKERAYREELQKNKELVKFSAAQSLGLYGDVKSVTQDRETLFFDEIGSITKKEWPSGREERYIYDGPLRFKVCEYCTLLNLEFTDNQRIVKSSNDKLVETYTFDRQGRLINRAFYNGSNPAEEIYFYEDEGKIPVKMVLKIYSDYGDQVRTYVYSGIEADENGNWTKRTVSEYRGKEEYKIDESGDDNSSGMLKENYAESRMITYY